LDKSHNINALLVDPSRFTAPYDAQLSSGLVQAGVNPIWAVRPLRAGETEELPFGTERMIFYRRSDRPGNVPGFARKPLKALAHFAGLWRLLTLARKTRADVIHFQWAVLPLFDALAMWLLRKRYPLVLTVHDSVPFNGLRMSFFQRFAFDLPMKIANRIIVHTPVAKRALAARGIPEDKIAIIPHGPLRLLARAQPPPVKSDGVWTFVMFGLLKSYKGIDTLIEAVGGIHAQVKGRARFLIAGAAHMDVEPLRASIQKLGVEDIVELRVGYLTNDELAALFAEADCFLFPYRQIDASGAYYLAKPLGKWIIASEVGIFSEDVIPGKTGLLVPPGQSKALAQAILESLDRRPAPTTGTLESSWDHIGQLTRTQYQALLNHEANPAVRQRSARSVERKPI
jgi:glycosyltransferase involved in cell wall biosynthesis